MAATFEISHDRFIRTTDADHYAASQALWRAMVAAGDIYLDRYEGWYSVRDEAYYDESELVDATDAAGQAVRLSPQGTAVEWTVEESWFFRLSTYGDRLLAWYDANPGCVAPASRMNEMRAFVERGLRDLSISRTSFDWGVPVPDADPDAPGHVMYVWVDALTNYLTGAGYPGRGYDAIWPADLHVIGKDVVRFHAVYWPAFLLSAGLALPKTVFGHGFILDRGGDKMSKSAGNVVDPAEMAATLGVDRLRWFMLRDVAFGEDGHYSHAAIVERTNADLANGIGNLAQRSLSMIAKNCNGLMPSLAAAGEAEVALAEELATEARIYRTEMAALRLNRGLEALMAMVAAANAYFADAAPWALKGDPDRRRHGAGNHRRCGAADRAARPAGDARRNRETARPARRRDRRADLRRARHHRCRRHAAAAARRRLPALGRAVMLVDSHCHLNYKGLREDVDGVIERARAAGVGTMLGHFDARKRMGRGRRPRRRASRHLGDGRHPPARGRRASASRRRPPDRRRRAPARRRHRRERASIISTTTATATGSRRASARISPPRATTGLPLIVHTRDAEDDTAAILTRRDGEGGLHRRHPLLHRERGICRTGACARVLHLALGHRHLQERPRPAGDGRGAPR